MMKNKKKTFIYLRASSTFPTLGDLTIEDDVRNIVNSTLMVHDRLDILINSAGIIEMGTIENTSLAQLDRMMNANVRSVYQLTMLALPHLIQSRGNIVNVSSVNGLRPVNKISKKSA